MSAHTFSVHSSSGVRKLDAVIERLVIAGWTGRNKVLVQQHIDELAAIGVPPPPSTPVFYRASVSLITSADAIQVVGQHSSGEVEFFILSVEEGLFVGVGSDHTDRKVETYDITVSKQMCAKPIGPDLWPLEPLLDRWDALVLRSHTSLGGIRRIYQEDRVSKMLAPRDIMRLYENDAKILRPGTMMFCGTLPVLGAIESGDRFEIALVDVEGARQLDHAYDVHSIPYVEER